jgi:hypothetical protein
MAMLALLTAAGAFGQTNTGEITGTVTDAQGGAMPGATVVARHLATGFQITRTSGPDGRFLLPGLPVGEYTLSVDMPGFKRAVRTGVVLLLGQQARLDFALELGSLSEEVTVASETSMLQTANAEVAHLVRNEQVVQLPLNARQFLQLALLTDNVVIPPGGTRGAALQQAGTLFNVAGQRSGHNIYLLDGVKVTDELFNNMVVSLSPDAIQEFKIQKSQYPAEFGGKAAALINVATKSGTSNFHGSLVEFLRNSAFDARNYFDDPRKPVPPLRQNQFGGSLGGPLARRKTFFFLNYEGQRIRKSLTQTFSVPSAVARAGDFSGIGSICDPVALDPLTGRCPPFPGNRIPASRLDPIAQAFLAKVPLPNGAGNVRNLTSVEPQRADMDQFTVRLDHRLTARDQLVARITAYDVRDRQPFGTSRLNETLVPGFGRMVTTKSRNLAFSHLHTFGTSVLNELRFGYLDVRGGQFSENKGVDFAGSVGLQGVTRDPRDVGYPQVSLAGLYSTMGDPTNFTTRHDTSFELYENVTLDKGRHRLKFGGYLFRLRLRPESPDIARGSLTYTGQFTGNALADFLLGYPAVAQAGIGRADENGRTTWLHVFAQDDWQVSPKLTVNAGLRVEFNRHMEDADNRLSTVDIDHPGGRFVIASDDQGRISPTAQTLLSKIPIPYTTSHAAGWDSSLLRPDYKRLAPRLGLVYRLPGSHETVVRGAFGIFLNQWAYSVQQAFAKNLPFFSTKTVNVASDVRIPTQTTASILTTDALGTVGASIMDWNYQVEYNATYTLDIQHLLTPRTTIELSLMASKTVGSDSSTIRNVPQPGPGPIAARRPIPQLGPISAIRWDGWEHYRSATIRIERRVAEGLSGSANYTWSRSFDDASDPGATVAETNLPQNVYDMAAERALSSYDHRHRLVASASYAPKWLRGRGGWLEALGAHWRVSGIVTVQSGAPFTVNLGSDRANIGSGPAQRPNVSGNPNLGSGRTPERWFNTSVFSLPAPFTFGTAGRNIVTGPGYSNVDMVFQKNARLSEKLRMEFRWEIFDLLNHPNFDLPSRIAFTPNFGRIFSAQEARQMQFGVKLIF